MDTNTVLSIVVALDQDAPLLEELITKIDREIGNAYRFYEIILIDNGSTDGTSIVIEPLLGRIKRIRYLRLSRKFGQDIALSAGIESAIGDYVVTLNPRTDPIDVVPEMVGLCRKSGGIVHGMAENPDSRSLIREIIGKFFRSYCLKHLGVDIKRGVSDLRVMSRQAVNALLQVGEQSRYLRVLTLTLGYQHEFYPYRITKRIEGERTTNWHSEITTAIDLPQQIPDTRCAS